MGKFVIKETKDGKFAFNLKAGNGEVIAVSETYTALDTCKNGIEIEGYEAVTNPKFEIYKDKAGEFRFRLKARNGEIIATGEGYKSKDGCKNGIDSIRRNAPDAEVVVEE